MLKKVIKGVFIIGISILIIIALVVGTNKVKDYFSFKEYKNVEKLTIENLKRDLTKNKISYSKLDLKNKKYCHFFSTKIKLKNVEYKDLKIKQVSISDIELYNIFIEIFSSKYKLKNIEKLPENARILIDMELEKPGTFKDFSNVENIKVALSSRYLPKERKFINDSFLIVNNKEKYLILKLY